MPDSLGHRLQDPAPYLSRYGPVTFAVSHVTFKTHHPAAPSGQESGVHIIPSCTTHLPPPSPFLCQRTPAHPNRPPPSRPRLSFASSLPCPRNNEGRIFATTSFGCSTTPAFLVRLLRLLRSPLLPWGPSAAFLTAGSSALLQLLPPA